VTNITILLYTELKKCQSVPGCIFPVPDRPERVHQSNPSSVPQAIHKNGAALRDCKYVTQTSIHPLLSQPKNLPFSLLLSALNR